jgi:hypothetical protein
VIPSAIAPLFVALAAYAQMSISGRVVDQPGNGVRMAEVTMRPEATPDSGYTAHTDNSGEFEVSGLAPGSYKVRVISLGSGWLWFLHGCLPTIHETS